MAPLVKVMEALREILAPAAPDHLAHLPSQTPEPDDDDDEDEEDERGSSGGNIDPDDDDSGYDDDDDDDDEEEEPLQTRWPKSGVDKATRTS
ncbi:MAG TPA: hypothetical protein VLQ46_13040 [Casimicrobiaceae bacterium]|nr:hypothetical protein [Casimicrobiaceae bacterium]